MYNYKLESISGSRNIKSHRFLERYSIKMYRDTRVTVLHTHMAKGITAEACQKCIVHFAYQRKPGNTHCTSPHVGCTLN